MSTAASTSADAPALWLRHARLLDLDSRKEAECDVLVEDGAIAAVGCDLAPDGPHEEIDAGGRYVLPGLVDLHTHVFHGVGDSVDADAVCLTRGAVTVADAGSAGAATIDAFARVARACRTEVLAWLNLSTVGLVDTRVGELVPGPYLDPEAAVTAARRHPDFVIGIKARLSTYAAGGGAVRVLRVLREVADELSLPVMVHVGDTTEPLEELTTYLRRGDVVTHAMTGRKHGILDAEGRLREGIEAARARGVLFDAGCGGNHLSFPVLARAAEQGFLPDTLSTDLTTHTARDPAFGLATLGTYLLAHGVPLHDTLARMIVAPAAVIGRSRPSSLAPGQPADLTIVAREHGPVTLRDVDGREMQASEWLAPAGTVRAGVYTSAAA